MKCTDTPFVNLKNISILSRGVTLSSNVIEYCSEKNISINLFDFRGKLLSIEGRAASCYWELIEKMLNDYIDFEGRVRKGAKDIVNCALNYGYGILYSRIWEVVISTGLNPNISYLHKSQDNDKPSLIYDLIEQFRQMVVDKAVFSIITKNEELKMENEFLDIKTRKRVAEKVLERLNCMESSKGDLMHRV